MKPKVIVIVGPTASGKTKLSIELAKKINGEIISADSMQIYREMDIGTAKVTENEKEGIKHYLIDIINPNERYTVSNFKNDAEIAISQILQNGKVPIVVGGTGLYVDALVLGIEYPEMKFDEAYRNELMKIAETEDGLEQLYNQAKKIDDLAMQKISPNDKKRIIRVLEIYKATGKNKTDLEIESRKNEIKYDFKVFALDMDRSRLYDRINQRVDVMIDNGLETEVRGILNKYHEFPTAMQGLGYKEMKMYIDGQYTKEEMVEKIKSESRHYAKRQLTWFRKNKDIVWLNAEADTLVNVDEIIREIS